MSKLSIQHQASSVVTLDVDWESVEFMGQIDVSDIAVGSRGETTINLINPSPDNIYIGRYRWNIYLCNGKAQLEYARRLYVDDEEEWEQLYPELPEEATA